MAQDGGSAGPIASPRPTPRRPSRFFHILLTLLFLLFLLQPLWARPLLGVQVGSILVSLILVGGTLAVGRYRFARWAAGLLAVVCLVSMHWPAHFDLLRPIKDASLVGWSLIVSVLLLVDLFGSRRVDGGSLSAALCVYMLLGLLFSSVYDAADWAIPGAFAGLSIEPGETSGVLAEQAHDPSAAVGPAGPDDDAGDPPARATERSLTFLYFSFVTLTTLGYGDVHPVAPFARMLAVLEALIGQIILVVLVARLVGLHVARAHGGGDP